MPGTASKPVHTGSPSSRWRPSKGKQHYYVIAPSQQRHKRGPGASKGHYLCGAGSRGGGPGIPWPRHGDLNRGQSAGCEQSGEGHGQGPGRSQGTKAEGVREGGPPPGPTGNPDLPQTLGPLAYAPYPSPVLSEEEDLLLDSPALEVSDSESDEALMAGPEGRGSEAGMWAQVAWEGLQLEMGVGG